MASGDDQALERARRDVYQYKVRDPQGKANSWVTGNGLIIMCEYYLLTGDSTVLKPIESYARTLENGQTAAGSWCHGMGMGGYGEVNATGLTCFIGLILARECGIEMGPKAIPRSTAFFRKFAGGGVPYGDHPPDPFGRTDNGKNGMAAVAYALLGDAKTASALARPTAYSYRSREMGHADGLFSFIWGPLGARHAPAPEFRMFLDNMLWYYELGRRPKGGLHSLRENHWPQPYGSSSGVGLFLMLPRKNLRILGAPKRIFGQTPPKGLEQAPALLKQKKWAQLKTLLVGFAKGDAKQQAYAAAMTRACDRMEQHADAVIAMIQTDLREKNLHKTSVRFEALVRMLGEERPEMATIRDRLETPDAQTVLKARPASQLDPNDHWKKVKLQADKIGPEAPIIWDDLTSTAKNQTSYEYYEHPGPGAPDIGDWTQPQYQPKGWKVSGGKQKTDRNSQYLVRQAFTTKRDDYRFLQLSSGGKATVYINGYRVATLTGERKKDQSPWVALLESAVGVLKPGKNVLAVSCSGRSLKLSLRAGPAEPDIKALRKGLAAYWKFDENQGSSVKCRISPKNAGMIGDKAQWVEGKLGSALNLAGKASLSVPGFREPIGPGGKMGSMTISFWARIDRREGVMLSKAPARKPKSGWSIKENSFECFNPQGKRLRASGPGNTKEWRHYVFVLDAGKGIVTTYANAGAVSGRKAMRATSKLDIASIAPSSEPLVIGAGGKTLKVIDELAIWSRTLSHDEIKMLCNAGAALDLRRN